MTPDEIKNLNGAIGSQVVLSGWTHIFNWDGAEESHDTDDWSDTRRLLGLSCYGSDSDIFLEGILYEDGNGQSGVSPVTSWRVGNIHYTKIINKIQVEDSGRLQAIWQRDIEPDLSVPWEQDYVENELYRQHQKGVGEHLSRGQSLTSIADIARQL